MMDTFIFGSYYYSDNEKKPIEWLVLDKVGSKLFLLSKYALDIHCYYEKLKSITWESSNIRSWLNNDFLFSAFNEDELKKIQTTKIKNHDYYPNNTNGGNLTYDKVFLLSEEDVLKYFKEPVERVCSGTPYVVNKGGYTEDSVLKGEKVYWWLRTIGFNSAVALNVDQEGEIHSRSVSCDYYAIRPAIFIDLEANCDLFVLEEEKNVYFGKYFLNDSINKEAILWRILTESDDAIMLISKYGLEYMPYTTNNNLLWKDCDVYKWLNNEFLNTAFTKEEAKIIIGDIVLLTVDEAKELFWDRKDRICQATKYVLDKGCYKEKNNNVFYWLKSDETLNNTSLVNSNGSVNCLGLPKAIPNVIRPVIWIRKSRLL